MFQSLILQIPNSSHPFHCYKQRLFRYHMSREKRSLFHPSPSIVAAVTAGKAERRRTSSPHQNVIPSPSPIAPPKNVNVPPPRGTRGRNVAIPPPAMSVTTKATIASFGGKLLKLAHNASTTNCEMGFNLYLPPQATVNPLHKVPLLIYLAGLTCTGDNGAEKGFFQHAASRRGIAVLYPDTSPRECWGGFIFIL